jgi:hypothetical protein
MQTPFLGTEDPRFYRSGSCAPEGLQVAWLGSRCQRRFELGRQPLVNIHGFMAYGTTARESWPVVSGRLYWHF